jgi:hypothetical protein
MDGFAYGSDVSFKGEILPGLMSWVNYSYLNTKEKTASGTYKRRLLDQTDTFRVFLQDRMPKLHWALAHVRMLFGSGFLYHPRKLVENDQTGEQYITVDYERLEEYPIYMRFDMGLTIDFHFSNNVELTMVTEVLNMFNNTNVAGYKWIQALKRYKVPIGISQVFTDRFFNVGFEARF